MSCNGREMEHLPALGNEGFPLWNEKYNYFNRLSEKPA
jgi:hypothetical protein